MNKLLELGNRYASKSCWKDFAMVKFCLAAIGIMIGIHIPEKKRKCAAKIALLVFFATYIPLMYKVFQTIKEMPE